MSKPFQFSMRRMFVAVTLIAFAASAISRMQFVSSFDLQTLLLLASSALIGAGVGEFAGRRWRGLTLGVFPFPPTWLTLCYVAWKAHQT